MAPVVPAAARRSWWRIRAGLEAAWKLRAELVLSVALLSGWMLITFAIAQLTAPIAWAFSAGALLLLLCGWRLLWRLFSDGLYDLTRARRTPNG